MKTLLTLLKSLALTLIPVLATAQAEDRSGAARAAMETLRPMAGEWHQTVSRWDGEKWGSPVEERTTIQYLLGDLALRERVPEHTESGVKMETTIQFDQYRSVYRLVAMDNSWGNMDVYESTSATPEHIVFENIRPGTFALGPEGQEYYFRLTFSIEHANAHQLVVQISADKGEHWQNFQRLQRRRMQ